MPQTNPSGAHEQFWVTEKGRYDLITAERCVCQPHLIGVLVECADCGTVYGHIRDLARAHVREQRSLTFKEFRPRNR